MLLEGISHIDSYFGTAPTCGHWWYQIRRPTPLVALVWRSCTANLHGFTINIVEDLDSR